MTYLMWELNPWLSVDEADTLPTELGGFYIYQAGFEPTTFRTTADTLPTELFAEYDLIDDDKILKNVDEERTVTHVQS